MKIENDSRQLKKFLWSPSIRNKNTNYIYYKVLDYLYFVAESAIFSTLEKSDTDYAAKRLD